MVTYVAVQDTFIDITGIHSLLIYSHSCNFKCPYCFNIDYLNSLSTVSSSKLPRLLQILNNLHSIIINDHKDYLYNTLDMYKAFIFSGGEPFLFKNDLRFALTFFRSIYEKSKVLAVQTTAYDLDTLETFINEELLDAAQIDVKTDPENLHKFTVAAKDLYTEKWRSRIIALADKSTIDLRTTVPSNEYIDVEKFIDFIDPFFEHINSFEIKRIKFVDNIKTDNSVFSALHKYLVSVSESKNYVLVEDSEFVRVEKKKE